MKSKTLLFSALTLSAVAGTLIAVGCTYDSTSRDNRPNACAGYGSRDDSANPEYDWADTNRSASMRAAASPTLAELTRASAYEYVHDDQQGTYEDTSTPARIEQPTLAAAEPANADGSPRERTDIYGRTFRGNPRDYEYSYDEQLGVYIDTGAPVRLASRDARDASSHRMAAAIERESMQKSMEPQPMTTAPATVDRPAVTDSNLAPSRDMASDTRPAPTESRINSEPAPIFTPIARADEKMSEPPAAPAPETTITKSPRETSKDVSKESLQSLTSTWSKEQQDLINSLVAKYGPPTEMSTNAVVWKNNGEFLCTKVMKVTAEHKFPKAHNDCLEQTISFKVPSSMASDIVAFNGSLIIDRTRGTLTAHCNSEELNLLTLNLANDIITKSRSVVEARASLAQTSLALNNGMSDPYCMKLQFKPGENTADPDSPAESASANAHQR